MLQISSLFVLAVISLITALVSFRKVCNDGDSQYLRVFTASVIVAFLATMWALVVAFQITASVR